MKQTKGEQKPLNAEKSLCRRIYHMAEGSARSLTRSLVEGAVVQPALERMQLSAIARNECR